MHQHRPKWPTATPELECSTRASGSSTSDDSILRLVRKVSRTCSTRASSVFKRAGWRPDKRIPLHPLGPEGGGDGDDDGGGDGDGISPQRSRSPVCESGLVSDLDPLIGAGGSVPSSIWFASCPSRTGTLRSKSIGMFQSCRNRLSVNSLRGSVDHIFDRGEGAAAYYFQLPSDEPPRLNVLQSLEPGARQDDSFRTSLESAIQEITARGRLLDYIDEVERKSTPPTSMTMSARGRAAGFHRTSVDLGEITPQPCEPVPERPSVISDAAGADQKRPSIDRPFGETTRAKLNANASIRRTGSARRAILQCSSGKNEAAGLAPSTARLVETIGITVVPPSDSIAEDNVKLVYPGLQEVKGRVEVCPSHDVALNTLEYARFSEPVHDLAYYDTGSRSYFLNPTCFLVDRGVESAAQARGLALVSLSRRWQTLKGLPGTESLRPGELDKVGASVGMSFDGDYVVISIQRTDPDENPIFVEEIDEPERTV
ncbi:uncharacterized protein DNG_03315 [Cephalotrichum gorgonifer]|uniref:Uncharacterized protein n=1 Tax=Cephalotrichum gorgonifer TaxID=2041049 RepID=A0AAE8STG4_9PEZI|nr:uncharacterized protein DNG_03315 [Cephalotrichum gorgonifer]